VGKNKYYSEIKRYITSKIRSFDDAEELTQCVFLEFYKSTVRDDNLKSHEAYLFGIARKMIGSYYRQKNKQPGFLEEVDPQITDKICYDSYSKDSRNRDLIEEIHSIIVELPPKARQAVELRLIEDLSSKEAAQKANCSIGIFYDRFYEGLRILRGKIHQ
jgi:RNA polymerase sigma factor (sigma-70 family)